MPDPTRAARLVPFRLLGIPGSYGQQLVHRAVLRPLYGPRPAPRDYEAAAANLLARWRHRVRALVAGGWSRGRDRPGVRRPAGAVQGRLERMLNCRPSAFLAEPATCPCCVRTICPHCWGREALATWKVVDALAFPAPPRGRRSPSRPGLALVRRVLTVAVPDDPGHLGRGLQVAIALRLGNRRWLPPALHAEPGRAADVKALRRAGIGGGLEVLRVTRPAGGGWRVQCRQVLAVPAGLDPAGLDPGHPALAATPPGWDSARSTVEPASRRRLMRAVGWAYAYPPFLLTGADHRVVKAYLAVRAALRCTARFGSFRARHAPRRPAPAPAEIPWE